MPYIVVFLVLILVLVLVSLSVVFLMLLAMTRTSPYTTPYMTPYASSYTTPYPLQNSSMYGGVVKIPVPDWIRLFDTGMHTLKDVVGGHVPDTFLDMWLFEQVGHMKYAWNKTPALERCLERYNKTEFVDDVVRAAKKCMTFMARLSNSGTVEPPTMGTLLSKRFAKYNKDDVDRVVAVYSTFIRYTGGNMQLATPPKNMDAYKRKYNITLEGFASPLNHWFPRFCSAFPSVDKPFGSIGSFFDTPIKENVICNPPFEEEVMDECITILEDALSKHKLTAVFICPKWDDTSCVLRANKSKYLVSKEEIPKEQANFVLWHGDKIVKPCSIYVYVLKS